MNNYQVDVQTSKGLNRSKNRDKYNIKQDEHILSVSLSDGASNRRYSDWGAEIISYSMNTYISENFELLYRENSISRMQRIIAVRIDNLIEQMTKIFSTERSQLGTTLLHISIKADRFIIVNIGDGIILGKKTDQNEILSRPRNGICNNVTDLCSQIELNNRIQVLKGYTKDYHAFFLMTDGWHTRMSSINNIYKFNTLEKDDDSTLISLYKQKKKVKR